MRQWLEAGYFKGDLPISQAPTGPFHQLSNWFPDLSMAFVAKVATGQEDPNIAAAQERQRQDAEAAANAERQRLAEEEEAQKKAVAQKESEEAAAARAHAAEKQVPMNGGNQSSNQLKMMLGLSSGGEQPAAEQKAPEVADPAKSAKKPNVKSSKTAGKKASQKTVDKAPVEAQP